MEATYTYIEQGLSVNTYMWADPGTLVSGDSCWFRITAYTPDGTLTGQTTSQKASVYVPDSATFMRPGPLSSEADLKLYPVPASDDMMIESVSAGAYHYDIYDASGKMMMSGMKTHAGHQTTIAVSSLEPGIYLFVINAKGENPLGIKFVVER